MKHRESASSVILSLMRSIHLIIVLWVFSSLASAAERFPIHAWIGVPAEQTTLVRYKELAECGFTSSFSGFPNAKAVAAALDIAHEAGVKLIISLPDLAKEPEATARQFMTHPALAGYYLQDEPSAADFPRLAKWLVRIESVDKSHPCYINLFPTYASAQQLGCPTYQEHVDRFIEQVPVRLVSFDHYPIVNEAIRPDWYQNLEIIRAASLRAGKPFWAFCLSVAHGPYPIPTIAHLRLQAHSNLAYGAQCIQYFTYWTPGSDATFTFHDAPIDQKGNRTATYAVVKEMNAEIQSLGSIFLGCKVHSVWHTGPQPAGTVLYEPAAPVLSLDTDAPALVSHLTKSGRHYLAIVNRDLKTDMKLQIAFAPGSRISVLGKSGSLEALGGAKHSSRFTPGAMAIFSWPAD